MCTSLGKETPAELGRRGESIARLYLTRTLGWNVIDTNVRSKYGEIDIVALDRIQYIFVEVKSRRTRRFGSPIEAVTLLKMARLRQQAEKYLIEHRITPFANIRLDVIGFDFLGTVVCHMAHVTVDA